MGKILKKGKVVILLSGRHAGKKAIIVKTFEEGTKKQKFPCALVAGMREGPRRVTRSMGKKKTEKNVSKIKPFIKYVNFTHVMPTRYQVDLDLQSIINPSEIDKETMKITIVNPSILKPILFLSIKNPPIRRVRDQKTIEG